MEILTPMTLTRDKVLFTGTAVKKFVKISDFPVCVKLGIGSGSGSTSKRHEYKTGSLKKRSVVEPEPEPEP
jgi:hypothetical protein